MRHEKLLREAELPAPTSYGPLRDKYRGLMRDLADALRDEIVEHDEAIAERDEARATLSFVLTTLSKVVLPAAAKHPAESPGVLIGEVESLKECSKELESERDAAITQRDEAIAAAVRWVRNSEGDGVANDLYIHLAAHLTAGKSEKTP